METSRLIDGIVRQTVVLIAALATATGQRTPLAHLADELFAELVGELKRQGLTNKVIADMFGVALRTYHRRLTRFSLGRSGSSRSLWLEVLETLQKEGPITRAALLQRFVREDEAVLRGVLGDLVDTGLVLRNGYGDATRFEIGNSVQVQEGSTDDALEAFITVCLHRSGGMTFEALAAEFPGVEHAQLRRTIERLQAAQLLRTEGAPTRPVYRCEEVVIPLGSARGWEAAVFDHHRAFVAALVSKLTAGTRRADLADQTGGSTYHFDLWRGHPMQQEVTGWLQSTREQTSALRQRLEAYNRLNPPEPNAERIRVETYAGQNVIEEDDDVL